MVVYFADGTHISVTASTVEAKDGLIFLLDRDGKFVFATTPQSIKYIRR